MFTKIGNKDHLVGLLLFGFLAMSLGGLIFLIGMYTPPYVNDIKVASLHENTCIKEREGAILEEKPYSLIMKYTMESEKFDIFCYNELIADMDSQNVHNILWATLYPRSAVVRWNEKEYIFTRPDKRFVITDSNVSTLLKEK